MFDYDILKTYRLVGINCVVYAKSETTVSGILAAAEALFLVKNYADVSMEDIAEAAGVTKGALYHHFASKEALYVAMMQGSMGDWLETITAASNPTRN